MTRPLCLRVLCFGLLCNLIAGCGEKQSPPAKRPSDIPAWLLVSEEAEKANGDWDVRVPQKDWLNFGAKPAAISPEAASATIAVYHRGLRNIYGNLMECMLRKTEGAFRLDGRRFYSLTIGKNGEVDEAKPLAPREDLLEFDEAICKYLRTWLFPAASQSTEVSFPLEFVPLRDSGYKPDLSFPSP